MVIIHSRIILNSFLLFALLCMYSYEHLSSQSKNWIYFQGTIIDKKNIIEEIDLEIEDDM